MKYSSIESMIKDRSWTRPSSYMGPDHNDTIQVIGRHRDSDLIAHSNFEVALERLGGESETVEVIRDSHWAYGWVEMIRVSKRDRKALKEVKNILNSLEAYALLDDDDYYERESEERERIFTDNKEEFIEVSIKALVTHTDVPESILNSLKTSKSFEALVSEAFYEAVSYSGIEDAWVCETNFVRLFQNMCRSNYANQDLNLMNNAIEQALGVK